METMTNYEIAEYLYGFMPMDDYPVEQGISELEKDIAELYESNNELYRYIESATRCQLFDKLTILKKPDDYKYANMKTEYGTSYSDITEFILRLLERDFISECDNNTHYNLIGNSLTKAPKNIVYVLSCGTENTLMEV